MPAYSFPAYTFLDLEYSMFSFVVSSSQEEREMLHIILIWFIV